MAGIYIHIPFCRQFCTYCDFYSSKSLANKSAVLKAVSGELERRRNFLNDKGIETVYFGGGTPSLLKPEEIGALMSRVKELYDTSGLKETTLEANPDDLDPAYLAELHETGIDRLSIGIQSFIDRDLKWMNRRHNAENAKNAVKNAKNAGFSNISADLIYGIPGMTLEEWEYNLDQMLELGVPHISAYHLTVEKGTALGKMVDRGAVEPVTEKAGEEQFLLLHKKLSGAGYEHYEVSNFARPGYRAVHNSNYWNGKEYLGAGPAAHSYNGARREWNPADITAYLRGACGHSEMAETTSIYDGHTVNKAAEGAWRAADGACGHSEMAETIPYGTAVKGENLTPDMLYNEYIMTALRTADGVDIDKLREKFGAHKLKHFLSRAEKFLKAGTIVVTDGKYSIPPEKFLVSDSVIGNLFA